MGNSEKDKEIKILDYTELTARAIAELLHAQWLIHHTASDTKSQYYCGITDNPERRKAKHEKELGKSINYLCICKCATADIAGEVEGMMKDKGFDIGYDPYGGNGKTEDSVYVYLYKK